MNLDFESKFRHIIMKMEEIGNLYAEAKGVSWQLQELKSSMIADLMRENGDLPISKSEVLAKSSESYKSYVKETAEAIKKELRLKCEFEKWKSSFEALRSLSSLEKATIHKIDGDGR